MPLELSIQNAFVQISGTLQQLTSSEYSMPSRLLFNASIGQHVRHIIELFLCLEQGYQEGVVNYEKRKRDYRIETDKDFAIELLHGIHSRLNRPNKDLMLESEDYDTGKKVIAIPSNYFREIVYNLEHTIHHMALIRVGVNELSQVKLPSEFGVAYSTIKYRQQCAQ